MAATPDRKPTGSATWKFEVLETLNADPSAASSCFKVLAAYIHYGRKPFMGISELMLRTGLTRPTIIAARRKLEELGYLVPLYEVGEGAMLYRVENPRKELVEHHFAVGMAYIQEQAKDRKREARQRLRTVKKTLPPQRSVYENNFTPVRKEILPNTVEYNRRRFSTEEREEPIKVSSAPSADNGNDATFPIPATDVDARKLIVSLLDGKRPLPAQMLALQHMLMNGTLRQSHIDALEDAA